MQLDAIWYIWSWILLARENELFSTLSTSFLFEVLRLVLNLLVAPLALVLPLARDELFF